MRIASRSCAASRILSPANHKLDPGYVFPRTPIPDDLAFIRLLQAEGILAVPGSSFGRGGYMRLSLTIPRGDMERALPGFERAIRGATGKVTAETPRR